MLLNTIDINDINAFSRPNPFFYASLEVIDSFPTCYCSYEDMGARPCTKSFIWLHPTCCLGIVNTYPWTLMTDKQKVNNTYPWHS